MKRVLIVDDNAMLANLYRSTFVAAGYAVDVANDGQAALSAAARQQPDVILLDVMLPGMSGVDVLAALRREPALAAVPVLVISNAYTPERTEQLWHAGATQLLVKANSTPNAMVDAVRAAIGNGRA